MTNVTYADTARDSQWMHAALAQAQAAGTSGEVPVGAVVVCHGEVIATGRNACVTTLDPTAHAEIMALRTAAQRLGNYRLEDCELFVTLEPCAMCAGAMMHARIKRVVFGAPDPKTGAAGSVVDLFAILQLNHHTQVQGGVMAAACSDLLQRFFKEQREKHRMARTESGKALRDDALRTPEDRFDALPGMLGPSCYVSDLPSLAGLRLHYVDTGMPGAPETVFCLHGPNDWSYIWRNLLAQYCAQGKRVVCPDLIGFGKSDKPKKESAHTLQWHTQVMLDLIERLGLSNITMVVQDGNEALAKCVATKIRHQTLRIELKTVEALNPQALDAPFPDQGHRAALRAFSTMITEPKSFRA